MARSKDFADQFPHFGVLIIIVLIAAVSFTVWAVNNVSTLTTQFAQNITCGTSNNNTCPKNYQCEFNSKNPSLGGECKLAALDAPKNLNVDSSCKLSSNGPNEANFNLSWDKVNYSNNYKIYAIYQDVANYSVANVKLGPFDSPNNTFNLNLPIPKKVTSVNFYVLANNSTYKISGAESNIISVSVNCK